MTDRELTEYALLPCPFCGFVPTIEHIHADESQGTKWGGVICDCGARSPEVRTGYAPVSEWAHRAIAEWNRRTPSSEGDGRDGERYRRWRLLAASGTMSDAVCEMMIAARTEDDIDAAIDAAGREG